MRRGALIATSIQLIDKVLVTDQSAKSLINSYIKKNRYIGAKDKKVIYELVFNTIRKYYSLSYLCEKSKIPATARNITLLTYINKNKAISLSGIYEGKYSLIEEKEDQKILNIALKLNCEIKPRLPIWLEKKLFTKNKKKIKRLYKSILIEPKFDIAINSLSYGRGQIKKKLKEINIISNNTKYSPSGITLEKRIPKNNIKKIKKNYFEVQDEGSQIMTLLTNVMPEHKVLDFCAGKGTKTIFIKNNFPNKNNLYVYDISKERLSILNNRLTELDIKGVKVLENSNDYENYFDLIICDVPCSATGTWRRRPETIVNLTEHKIKQYAQKQSKILDSVSHLCNKNGEIAYITCSLIADENEKQVKKFLKKNNFFKLVNIKERWEKVFLTNNFVTNRRWFTLSPHMLNTDGYFISILKKIK